MGCMHSKNNLPKVIDSDTGLPMQKPKCSKKTLKAQNAAKAKMNKAMAEVKAKGDAKLAAALAEFGGIQLPAATIQQTLNKQTITKQTPLPEQAIPMEILKALMKNDGTSSPGMDDADALPVSFSTDVIAEMTINETMSKTEDLKEQTESAQAIERPASSAESSTSRLIIVTAAKSSVDNTLGEKQPTTTTVPSKVEELTNDSDTMMSDDNDVETLVKDEQVTKELAQLLPTIERPTSSASVCSRLIVVTEANTSVDNTLDETIPAPPTTTSPKTEEKKLTNDSDTMSDDNDVETLVKDEQVTEELAQLLPAIERPTSSASVCSRLIAVTEANTSVDNTLDETILAPPTTTSPKTEEKTLIQLVGSSASSLDKATTNLVDAVFTCLDNEETVQESIAVVQNSDAAFSDCDMPATEASTRSLDQEAGLIVDSVSANITKEKLSLAPEEPKINSTAFTAMDTEVDMSAVLSSTPSLDQEAGSVVGSVLANITKGKEQLPVAPEEPKMKSTGPDAIDTEDDMSLSVLDREAALNVSKVLANISPEDAQSSQSIVTTTTTSDKPLDDDLHEVSSTSLDQHATNLVEAVLASISTKNEKLLPLSKLILSINTTDDLSVSTRSEVDKDEIIRVIVAQLKKSSSSVRHSSSQMATQTREISIQTDDDVIEPENPSRKFSAFSKIKAAVVKSASKKSRTSLIGRKDKKSNENIKKDLKNNKQALSQSKTKCVSTKKPGPKNAKVLVTKKSANAKSDVTKKPTSDHKKLSDTKAKKYTITSTHNKSSSTDHKKSLTKPRGSAASGRMIREAANGAKVSSNVKLNKKLSTTISSASATTDVKIKENPAQKLNVSKSASFPCNGSQQKPTASASAAKTKPNESCQSASDMPNLTRSKQRAATAVPPPLHDKSSLKSKSSCRLKKNRSSFLAPQDVASSPSVHGRRNISSVEGKDSNIALITVNSQDNFKPNPKVQKRSGRNGSKSRVSITSDNTLRRISSACPAPGPKRSGLASVPELRPISVMDTPTDAGHVQNPRCHLDQAMGDNIEVQPESQSSVTLKQDDVTFGIPHSGNQFGRLQQLQEMDNHSMDLQPSSTLVSPSQTPKVEILAAALQTTKPLSDKDQVCKTPEVVSSMGLFSPRCRMTAEDSGESTDPVSGQPLEVSKSLRERPESPPGKTTTILNPKPPDSKRTSRDFFTMNQVTQWTQDSVGLNMGQFTCDPKSPGGSTSKLSHHVKASESPQGKTTPTICPTQPASSEPLRDFLNGPDTGQSITHGNPSNKRKPVLVIPMIQNLSNLSSDFVDELVSGQSMKVSKTDPGETPSISPEGRISVSPTNKRMSSKTSLFLPANNNKPFSGTMDSIDHPIQELTCSQADKGECTSPTYHSVSTADSETHQQQESAKLQLGCSRLQN